MGRLTVAIAALAAAFALTGIAQAVTPAVKCEADKLRRAGKYSFCRLKAEARAVKTGNAPDYSLCDLKLGEKWTNAETVGAGQCPTNGDLAPMQARITADADDVAACLSGACPPACGDGTANGAESCDGVDLAGASCTTLGFASGTLACTAVCGFDVSGCVPVSNSCGDSVINGTDSCDGPDLGGATCASLGYTLGGTLACTAGCGWDVSGCQSQAFPATGQTTSYGLGSDGDVESGATLAYTDNLDGTITDNNTHLMWEKKSDDGSIHDWNNAYSWCQDTSPADNTCDTAGNPMDGEIVTTFLGTLNDVGGGGVNCFAGHCDWRIPNRNELLSIVNLENVIPSVSPAFNTACAPACTVLTCSCTQSERYWSSSTYQNLPNIAWYVNFYDGFVSANAKALAVYVRAVRGGS